MFDELYDKLLDYEIFLQCEECQQQSLPIIANHSSHSSFLHDRSKQLLQFSGAASFGHNAPSFAPSAHGRCTSSSSSNLVCQFCDKHGYIAKKCYKLHGYPPDHPCHQANLVHKDSHSEPSWLFDSGASHHATRDLANLSLTHGYTDNDKIVVANGKGLPITHSGSTTNGQQ